MREETSQGGANVGMEGGPVSKLFSISHDGGGNGTPWNTE